MDYRGFEITGLYEQLSTWKLNSDGTRSHVKIDDGAVADDADPIEYRAENDDCEMFFGDTLRAVQQEVDDYYEELISRNDPVLPTEGDDRDI